MEPLKTSLDIYLIKLAYPNLYISIKNLYICNQSIQDLFDKYYGKNTLQNIIKTNEYNIELDNVRNGINEKGEFNKIAQKYDNYFKYFLLERTNVEYTIGKQNTNNIIKNIEDYLCHKKNFTHLGLSQSNDSIIDFNLNVI